MVWAEVISILISAIPLHIAVKLLGGRTNFIKTILVTLLGLVIFGIIGYIFSLFAGLIAFIILIWIYHEVFRLKWIKAILAWILQILFLWIFLFILALLGVAVAVLTVF